MPAVTVFFFWNWGREHILWYWE